MGITSYRLFRARHLWYQWELGIDASRGGYYTFTDASNDTYSLSVLYGGQHNVQYNSKAPAIKEVMWWA